MKLIKLFTFLGLVLIAGCTAVTPIIATNNTAFFVDNYSPKGSIAIVSGDANVNSSLEFAAYKRKFETKLSLVGYTIESDPNKADYIGLVAYGIDKGETSTVSTPIFGQTGGGTIYSSGTIHSSGSSTNFSSSNYTMPTYGVVGSATGSITVYNRAIALDIVDAKSFKKGNPIKIYEGRTRSKGSCSVIVEVFDEMLEAMFSDFPGENGRNRKQDIPGDFNC